MTRKPKVEFTPATVDMRMLTPAPIYSHAAFVHAVPHADNDGDDRQRSEFIDRLQARYRARKGQQ